MIYLDIFKRLVKLLVGDKGLKIKWANGETETVFLSPRGSDLKNAKRVIVRRSAEGKVTKEIVHRKNGAVQIKGGK